MTRPALNPAGRAGRTVRVLCQVAFWAPLALCTYLALVPEPPDNPVFRLSDVILHAAAFTYLSFALLLAQSARPVPRNAALAGNERPRGELYFSTFGLMLAYGVFLELVQAFVPERSAELKDLFVDAIGIAVGLLLARFLAVPLLRAAQRIVAWL